MNSQRDQVKVYFDELAASYSKKYSTARPYHAYFFHKRLLLATQDFDLEGKTILDIGGGTGALYDYLEENVEKFDYFAFDISEKMLDQSNIPENQRFVGDLEKIDFPVKHFDFIFLLGVTTYLSKEELNKYLQFISRNSSLESTSIITFTNRSAIDYYLRKGVGLFAKTFYKNKSLLTQSFPTSSFSIAAIENLLKEQFHITKCQWFNFTYSPFNHIFPKFSVKFSKFLDAKLNSSPLQKLMGADIILFLKKK